MIRITTKIYLYLFCVLNPIYVRISQRKIVTREQTLIINDVTHLSINEKHYSILNQFNSHILSILHAFAVKN